MFEQGSRQNSVGDLRKRCGCTSVLKQSPLLAGHERLLAATTGELPQIAATSTDSVEDKSFGMSFATVVEHTTCRAAGHEHGVVLGRSDQSIDGSIGNLVKGRHVMLGWALTFLVIALIAGVLGFGGIAGTAAGIAKILFFVFLVLFVISLLFGRRAPI
jgi:uncharacterized membrane protein YtjA (UPF0391 family)